MNNDVNFLREKINNLKKRRRQFVLIQLVSFGALIIYGIVLISIFSYGFILQKESAIINEKTKDQKNKIEKLKPVEAKQYYLKNKLVSLSEVFNSQRKNQAITEAVFAMLPEGISINGFIIDEKGGVRFSAACARLDTITNFFANLESTPRVGDLDIKIISIDGVNFNYKVGYSFNIYLLFEG